MKRAHLSEQAESDLADIWAFIAQHNEAAADRFVALIRRRCQLRASSPGLGRARPELGPDLRSFRIGNYLVFYRTADDGIDVVRVLSGFRDLPAQFR